MRLGQNNGWARGTAQSGGWARAAAGLDQSNAWDGLKHAEALQEHKLKPWSLFANVPLKCIESAVKEITKHLDQIDEIDYEIIFVNDHSTDNSLQLILEQRKINKRIKVINLSRRFGHMPSIMAGLRNATGDAAIYLDIDLQDPPELIPKMVNYWLHDNYDVVYTTRKKTSGNNFF